jgi:hypothetical protein
LYRASVDQSEFFALYLPRFNSPFSIARSSSASTSAAKSSISHTRLATAHYLCRVMAAMLRTGEAWRGSTEEKD